MSRLMTMPVLTVPILTMLMSPALSGCPGVCEGAGCQDLYEQADLLLLSGAVLGGSEALVARADGEVLMAGTEGAGYDWPVMVSDGRLVVGQPSDGLVRLQLVGQPGSAATIQSAQSEEFGGSLGLVGGRLVVGAPRHAPASGGGDAGALYLYGELSQITGEIVAESGQQIEGLVGERLGGALAGCADLDGDGQGDLLVQAEWGDEGGELSGEVWMLSSRGLDAANRASLVLLPGQGAGTGARLGAGIACTFPLGSSEDQPDVAAGAPFASVGGGFGQTAVQGVGQVLVWKGGEGIGGADPILRLNGYEEAEYFGYAVATGDVDGDGETDLIVGAPGHNPRLIGNQESGVDGMAGAVYVFTATKLSSALDIGFPGTVVEPAFVLSSRYESVPSDCGGLKTEELDLCENAYFSRIGSSVAVGDFNGDGIDDLMVGAPGWRLDNEVEVGKVWVLEGPSDLWSPGIIITPVDTSHLDIDIAASRTVVGSAAFEQVGAQLHAPVLTPPSADLLLLRRHR